MKIPQEICDEYREFDPEATFFLSNYDEPTGLDIIEVGARNAPLAQMLAKCGNRVVSVDMRPHDHPLAENHTHIEADFVSATIPPCFDVAVSVSALEHFGMGTYGDPIRPYYDILTSRKIWEILKPGGVFYCLVPFGGKYFERHPHYRVYDYASLIDRIVQELKPDWLKTAFVEKYILGDTVLEPGTGADWLHVFSNLYGCPSIAALVRLVKL